MGRTIILEPQSLNTVEFLLRHGRELQERGIVNDPTDFLNHDFYMLMYVRALERDHKIDIDSLPMWGELEKESKEAIKLLIEYEYYPQERSRADWGKAYEKFYKDPAYRARILSEYREKFKPFCEQKNREQKQS